MYKIAKYYFYEFFIFKNFVKFNMINCIYLKLLWAMNLCWLNYSIHITQFLYRRADSAAVVSWRNLPTFASNWAMFAIQTPVIMA